MYIKYIYAYTFYTQMYKIQSIQIYCIKYTLYMLYILYIYIKYIIHYKYIVYFIHTCVLYIYCTHISMCFNMTEFTKGRAGHISVKIHTNYV